MRGLRIVCSWVAWWLPLLVLYLLLTGKPTWEEASAGLAAAAIATVGAVVAARAAALEFQPRLRWLVRLGRPFLQMLLDCCLVLGALWPRLVQGKNVEGVFSTIPFDPGGDDPQQAARRALITVGITLAPNTYVIGMDRQQGLILVHQLIPTRQPPGNGNREWPL